MSAPVIPPSAPITESQRAWLNGFFAGLFGSDHGASVVALASQNQHQGEVTSVPSRQLIHMRRSKNLGMIQILSWRNGSNLRKAYHLQTIDVRYGPTRLRSMWNICVALTAKLSLQAPKKISTFAHRRTATSRALKNSFEVVKIPRPRHRLFKNPHQRL